MLSKWLALLPKVFNSGNPPNSAEINSNQSSVDLFFFSKKIFNLFLKSKVLNKSSPGDLIKSISSSRFGYGGPEITSTLWLKFLRP